MRELLRIVGVMAAVAVLSAIGFGLATVTGIAQWLAILIVYAILALVWRLVMRSAPGSPPKAFRR